MKIDQIYCDMDEVLSNFLLGACQIHERSYEELDKPGRPWSLVEYWGLKNSNELWNPILQKGPDFWVELEMFPWAKELLSLLQKFSERPVILLTTPNYNESSYVGKIRWIVDHLGEEWVPRFQPTYDKRLFAKPGCLLVDDSLDNIRKFVEEGALGILFPSSGNILGVIENPVPYVEKRLEWMTQFMV